MTNFHDLSVPGRLFRHYMAADERAEFRSELSLSAGNTKMGHGNGPGPAVCISLSLQHS